jgi:hypothetical protein
MIAAGSLVRVKLYTRDGLVEGALGRVLGLMGGEFIVRTIPESILVGCERSELEEVEEK